MMSSAKRVKNNNCMLSQIERLESEAVYLQRRLFAYTKLIVSVPSMRLLQ